MKQVEELWLLTSVPRLPSINLNRLDHDPQYARTLKDIRDSKWNCQHGNGQDLPTENILQEVRPILKTLKEQTRETKMFLCIAKKEGPGLANEERRTKFWECTTAHEEC
jgi:hypothetical protein